MKRKFRNKFNFNQQDEFKETEKSYSSNINENKAQDNQSIYKTSDFKLANLSEIETFKNSFNTNYEESKNKLHIISSPEIKLLEEFPQKILDSNLNTEVNRINVELPIIEIKDFQLLKSEFISIPILENTFSTDYTNPAIELNIYRSNDLHLITNTEHEEMKELSTEIKEVEMLSLEEITENLLSKEGGSNLLEELLQLEKEENDKGTLPRSFSEGLNKPLVIILEEGSKEWHEPILYVLKELYREIEEDYPKIIYRFPETSEESDSEKIDSFDSYHLNSFSFEKEIEVLNLKRYMYPLDDFLNYLEGRLKTAFLKRFGILFIITEKGKGKIIKKKLKHFIKGLDILLLRPSDENYEYFCKLITGIYTNKTFTEALKDFDRLLNSTVRDFSVYVSRNKEGKDKYQYPYKVAAVVCLISDILQNTIEGIKNSEELEDKILEALQKIEVEKELTFHKVIPDILYEGKIAVEIETLIGTIDPLKKIDETILKYSECEEVEEIWIVLRPVSAFLHYRDLIRRKRILEKLSNKKVKFFVLISEGKKWKLIELPKWKALENWLKSGRII